MYVKQDNKVHFDKSDLIDPVIPSPFWKKPSIIMTNPEVQIIAEKCDNEKMHKQVKLIDQNISLYLIHILVLIKT